MRSIRKILNIGLSLMVTTTLGISITKPVKVSAEENLNFDNTNRVEEVVRKTDTEEERKITLSVDKEIKDNKQRKKFDIEILIDASGSMKENDENMQKSKEILKNFIKERDSNYDRVGVTIFRGKSLSNNLKVLRSETIETIHELDDNLNEAIDSINSIEPGGYTPLLEGLDKAKEDLDNSCRADSDEKILIILGDGHPNIGPSRDYFYAGIGDYYGENPNYYPGYKLAAEKEELSNLLDENKIDSDEYIEKIIELSKREDLYPGAKKKNLKESTLNSVLNGGLYDNSKAEFYDLKYLIEKKANEIKESGYKVYSVFLNNERPESSSYKKFLDNTNENEKLFKEIATDEKYFLYADNLQGLLENFKTINNNFTNFNYRIKDSIENGFTLVPESLKSSVNEVQPIISDNTLTWEANNINNNHFEVSYNIIKKADKSIPVDEKKPKKDDKKTNIQKDKKSVELVKNDKRINKVLPNTGAMIGTRVIVIIAVVAAGTGIFLVRKNKKEN